MAPWTEGWGDNGASPPGWSARRGQPAVDDAQRDTLKVHGVVLVEQRRRGLVPAGLRDSYVTEVAAVTKPGADLYLAGVADPPATWRLLGARGANADDLRGRFGAQFELVDERKVASPGRAGPFIA